MDTFDETVLENICAPEFPIGAVLWDLDGTLTDSAPVILPAMAATLSEKLNIQENEANRYLSREVPGKGGPNPAFRRNRPTG